MTDTNEQKTYLAWIDLETTGLYGDNSQFTYGERDHKILEVAMIITDADLFILDTVSYLVKHDLDEIRALSNDYVIDMHTKSRLLDDLSNPNKYKGSLYEVETELVRRLNSFGSEGDRKLLAGSSIHFDRFFISSQMRRLNRALHYRNFDTSTIKEFYRLVTGEEYTPARPAALTDHRALADISYSLCQTKDIANKLQKKSGISKFFTGLFSDDD